MSDSRYNSRRNRVKNHFKHGGRPRTKKDMERPRFSRPAGGGRASGGGDRRQNKAIAAETLEILEQGFYTYSPESEDDSEETTKVQKFIPGACQSGPLIAACQPGSLVAEEGYEEQISKTHSDQVVDLKTSLRESRKNTVEYTPAQSQALTELMACRAEQADKEAECKDPGVSDPSQPTQYEVELETTLSGAQRLASQGLNVAVLNFASARNPGGGFIKGSNAQEESLARSSGLYHCIKDCQMYQINEADNQNCLYSHQMIYSPGVPVFRDGTVGSDTDLLPPDEVYHVAFISAPAVNAGQARTRLKKPDVIHEVMYDRLDRILAVAKHHGHNALVLGAYGCGVFGNDIEVVGEMFKDLLTEKYQGVFTVVLFSILGQMEYEAVQEIFEQVQA